ncbi:MAG: DUF2207 domain-containing protein [Propionibacteriaceae bacterium]|nr:DUF2207 domain-containing protein [Propionibacteriaceae bacterium]
MSAKPRLRRLIGAVTAGVVLCIAGFGCPSAYADGTEITRFSILATLNTKCVLSVTEIIDVSFVSPTQGIDLWLVTRRKYDSTHDQMFRYSNIRVGTSTGAPTSFRTIQHADALQIQVGDPDRWLVGPQTYVLRYDMTGLVTSAHSSNSDPVLWWTVIGSDWQIPISNISVNITAPTGGESRFPTKISSASEPWLAPSESWSISWSFPPGTFSRMPVYLVPSTPKLFGVAIGERTGMLVGIGVAVAALLALVSLNGKYRSQRFPAEYASRPSDARHKRDAPQTDTQVAECVAVASAGVPPQLAGAVIQGRASMRDINATVAALAVNGYVHITRSKASLTFQRTDFSRGPLDRDWRRVYDWMFASGPTVTREELMRRGFRDFSEKAACVLQANFVEQSLNPLPDTTVLQWVGAIIAVVGTAAAVLVGAWLLGIGRGGFGWLALPFIVVGLGIIQIAPVAPIPHVDALSKTDLCRDFQHYLETAEASQIDPEEALNLFCACLPYAVAFGCADRWARPFDALVAQGVDLARPTWFTEAVGGGPLFRQMSHSVDNVTTWTWLSRPSVTPKAESNDVETTASEKLEQVSVEAVQTEST